MEDLLKGKTALITGASSGIGEAVAVKLAEKGLNLILCARNQKKLLSLKVDLESKYNINVLAIKLDVSIKEDVFTKLASLPSGFKDIDVLINNAGLASGLDLFQDSNIEDSESMITTNILGLTYIVKAVLPSMLLKNSGYIINIGSISGDFAYQKGAVYCATKAFVKTFSDGLRADLVSTNIKVCNLKPGMVETNFSNVRFKGDREKAKNVYNIIEPLKAEDIAEAVANILSYPAHVQVAEVTILPTNQAVGIAVSKPK